MAAEDDTTAGTPEAIIGDAEERLNRAKAELAVTALVRRAQDDLAERRAAEATRLGREADDQLLAHVRGRMAYAGTLTDTELLAILPRVDPSTREGAERLEAFRERHFGSFRPRGIALDAMTASNESSFARNPKLVNNPFFNARAGLKSLGKR